MLAAWLDHGGHPRQAPAVALRRRAPARPRGAGLNPLSGATARRRRRDAHGFERFARIWEEHALGLSPGGPGLLDQITGAAGRDGALLWKSCFAKAVDINLS